MFFMNFLHKTRLNRPGSILSSGICLAKNLKCVISFYATSLLNFCLILLSKQNVRSTVYYNVFINFLKETSSQ